MKCKYCQKEVIETENGIALAYDKERLVSALHVDCISPISKN